MSIPLDFQTVRVFGNFVNLDGAPAQGTVTFTPSPHGVVYSPGTSTGVALTPFVVTLDEDGQFELDLPATDDPDIVPAGWLYTVERRLNGDLHRFRIAVPRAGGDIDLNEAAPVLEVPKVFRYVATVNGEAPDATGNVDVEGGGGGGGDVEWTDVQDKPTTFPPSTHTHAYADVTDKPSTFPPEVHTHDYGSITGKPSTFTPSAHTHAYSDITGTPSIPNSPDDIGAQPAGDYATQTALSSGLSGKSNVGHAHSPSDVVGLASVATSGLYGDLSGKPTIPTVPGDIGAQPAGSYATTTALTSGLAGKSNTGHTHTAGEVSGLATVATTGAYTNLTGKPTIPSVPGDIGAQPAGDYATNTNLATKITKGAIVLNAADYGATGNGTTDDTTAIQAALTAATASKATVVLPRGSYLLSSSLMMPSGVTLEGQGTVRLLVVNGGNFPVIWINGLTAHVSGVSIEKAGATVGASTHGVYIYGASNGVTLTDVSVDTMATGFYVRGDASQVTRLVMTRCVAKNCASYAFEIDECDGIEMMNCRGSGSAVDNVKLRKKAKNVSIYGGAFTGALGGDGLDAYAGGDNFSIIGTEFSGNSINGITVKNDDLNRTDSANYGFVRNLVISNVRAFNNGGNGVTVHRSSGNPDDPTEPLVVRATLTSIITNGNTNYGFYIQSRQVTLSGCHAYRNGMDGFKVEPAALDVTLTGCHASANSQGTANTYSGFSISGSRISIFGGSSIGSDPDGAIDDAALAAGTKTQKYGIRVEATATEVRIDGLNSRYNATADESDLSGAFRPSEAGAIYIAPGKYVGGLGGTRTTLGLAANTEYAYPVWFGNAGTIVRIGVEITNATTTIGTVLRLGVRKSIGISKDPGPVLGEATVNAPDPVAAAALEATVSIVIPSPGFYWLTCTAQNTGATLPTVRAQVGVLPVWNGTLGNALGTATSAGYITAATVTGALPSTYTVAGRSSAPPLVVVRG